MRKYIRPLIGVLLFFFGLVFMFIPMIPLGYLLLAAGAVVLAPFAPPVQHFLDWWERKDSSGRVGRVRQRVDARMRELEGRTERS